MAVWIGSDDIITLDGNDLMDFLDDCHNNEPRTLRTAILQQVREAESGNSWELLFVKDGVIVKADVQWTPEDDAFLDGK
jgi:hypothetical protein